MPIFSYKCEMCGYITDEYFKSADSRERYISCNLCGNRAKYNIGAQTVNSTEQDYAKPVLSETIGVQPHQVQDHKRAYPDVPITPDGRVIMKSHAERKRILKRLGYMDRDSYY